MKDPDFANRKRCNVDARECFNNTCFTSNMLDHVVAYYDNDMDPIEL